ncbi:MAG: cytoskeleton protein RodZ [Phenylobacterium sp.]|jgi:cytoskeleton protein RodZ
MTKKIAEELTEEISEHTEVMTPGLLLKEARVSLQMTPAEIARKLNLRESLIIAIEDNDFDAKTSMTFTRGYLKGYAKLVHVEEVVILQAFEYWNNAEQQQLEMQSFSHRSSQKALDNRLSIVSYLVVAILLVMVVVWWFQRNEAPIDAPVINTTANSAQTVTQSQTAEGDSIPALSDDPQTGAVQDHLPDKAQDEAQDNSPAANESGQGVEVSSALGSETGSAEELALALDQQIASELDSTDKNKTDDNGEPLSHLELRFSDSCWINVKDARGKRIAIGTKARGHLTSVYGLAPFEIKLGKPDVVSIWLDGEQRTLPFYPKGRVANFQLTENSAE